MCGDQLYSSGHDGYIVRFSVRIVPLVTGSIISSSGSCVQLILLGRCTAGPISTIKSFWVSTQQRPPIPTQASQQVEEHQAGQPAGSYSSGVLGRKCTPGLFAVGFLGADVLVQDVTGGGEWVCRLIHFNFFSPSTPTICITLYLFSNHSSLVFSLPVQQLACSL